MDQSRQRSTTQPQAAHVRAVSRWPLLFGFLVGPVAWSLHEIVSLILISSACSTSTHGFSSFTILGTAGWRWVLLLYTLALMILAAIGFGVSFREWRATQIGGGITGAAGGAAGRSGWMSVAGMMLSGLFFGGIVIAGIAIFFLAGCS